MTAIRSMKQQPIQFNHFEHLQHTFYSHGLEDIYTLETIDLNTVRPLTIPDLQHHDDIVKQNRDPVKSDNQLELDFGDAYRESTDSFLLVEPVCVLKLSRQAERSLLEQGVERLEDLLGADLSTFIYFKGMGQGHIDEIRQKLKNYLDGNIIYNSPYVDFGSWLRSLILTRCTKKMFLLLEQFQLSDLLTLSPAESVEVRRLSLEKQLEWRKEIQAELLVERNNVESDIRKIVEVYIKPWMVRRHGFTTPNEIVDRIQRVARQPILAPLIVKLIADVYFEGRFIMEMCLPSCQGLYFADFVVMKSYTSVVEMAKTYFYKNGLIYDLFELKNMLSREFAKSWIGFADGFIEKCLRASPHFRVRKDDAHRLSVQRS